MLVPDLYFNLSVLVLDLVLVLCLRRLLPGKRRFISFLLFASYLAAGAEAIRLVTDHFNLRPFAMMRFFGHFIFFHLPFVLGFAAYHGRKLKVLSRSAGVCAVLLLGIYIHAYHVEPYRLEVTRYEYRDPRLQGLERPIVIAQISDIQFETVGAYEKRVVKRLKELNPDLILHTGDYIQAPYRSHWDQSAYLAQVQDFNRLMIEAGLDPPLGSYAVTGDCENPRLFEENLYFSGTPVILLNNKTTRVELPGTRIQLIGLDCLACRSQNPEIVERLTMDLDDEYVALFFGHRPDFAIPLAQLGKPFLALAGHTHGGQVQLPFIGPLITLSKVDRCYADDYLPYGPGVLSVSRGIGMERCDAPQLRFLCRPEIRLITLMPPDHDKCIIN